MKKALMFVILTILIISFTGCSSVRNSKGEPSQELADSVINESH